jgi:uncharacterized membrane protein YhaH (DUF805 family)
VRWYLAVLKKYAVLSGRARRTEYWMFALFTTLIAFGLIILDTTTGVANKSAGFGVLTALYMLATFIPGFAVSVRRLHDIGRSAWWLLIGIVPLIGGLVLLIFTVMDGERGENRYGPNPKGVTLSGAVG